MLQFKLSFAGRHPRVLASTILKTAQTSTLCLKDAVQSSFQPVLFYDHIAYQMKLSRIRNIHSFSLYWITYVLRLGFPKLFNGLYNFSWFYLWFEHVNIWKPDSIRLSVTFYKPQSFRTLAFLISHELHWTQVSLLVYNFLVTGFHHVPVSVLLLIYWSPLSLSETKATELILFRKWKSSLNTIKVSNQVDFSCLPC